MGGWVGVVKKCPFFFNKSSTIQGRGEIQLLQEWTRCRVSEHKILHYS